MNTSQPVETTLISITTASTNANRHNHRTYGNRSLSNSVGTNKANNNTTSKANTGSTKANQTTSANNKISCFTCNQLFASHYELSEHKCSIPVVTITKEIPNMLNNKHQIELNDNQNETHQLILTTDKLGVNGEQQCFLMTSDNNQDGSFKHAVILQTTNLSDANTTTPTTKGGRKKAANTPASVSTSSSHNRFMESNKKTYDFQNRAKKTYSLKNKQNAAVNQPTVATTTTINQNQLFVNDAITSTATFKSSDNQQQQIFIETQSPINQQTQLILTDANQLATLNSNLELDSNAVSTIQALIQDNQLIQTGNNEVLQIPIDQSSIIMQDQAVVSTNNQQQPTTATATSATAAITVDQSQAVATEAQISAEQLQQTGEQINDTNQYIMIQQQDGQCVQICIPDGMDVDEVIKNLNFTWQGDEQGVNEAVTADQQQTTQFLDTQQILDQQQMIADQVNQQNQLIATTELGTEQSQEAQLITTDQQAQLNIDQSAVEQLQGGEQVIYLPINDDGTCALDAESLAMLTGNGDIPIIVSSSN